MFFPWCQDYLWLILASFAGVSQLDCELIMDSDNTFISDRYRDIDEAKKQPDASRYVY